MTAPSLLPLILCETPPGLELILTQEGVAFHKVAIGELGRLSVGRFLLFDSRRISKSVIGESLSKEFTLLDIHFLRNREPFDPFEALVDTKASISEWMVEGLPLRETISRRAKGIIRQSLIELLRAKIQSLGGIWARLSPFPFPYTSAFNFRIDLDEDHPDDYALFAKARRPLDACSTHFLSTHAYGHRSAILDDLRRLDTQSHGHFHHIFDDRESNRRNLEEAHRILKENGIEPTGFAAPHGRWSTNLNSCLEVLGYAYSSDFQIGYDDLPFYPWLGDRFSNVLQIPIHPICEGLFLDSGVREGKSIADYFSRVVREKVELGEPAFVYGHPERRLARFPEILHGLADEVLGRPEIWRVTLTEFASWWKQRAGKVWSLRPTEEGRMEVEINEVEAGYPVSLEIWQGERKTSIHLKEKRTVISLDDLVFQPRRVRSDLPLPTLVRPPFSLRAGLRKAIDWEKVTPLDSLPERTSAQRIKKRLRRFQESRSRSS